MFNYTEDNIAELIALNQKRICTSYDILVPKCYSNHDNECDVLALRKSGFCDEFEIKTSRSDFLSDCKKKVAIRTHDHNNEEDVAHLKLSYEMSNNEWKKIVAPWERMKYEALTEGLTDINYFWYVVKHDIVEDHEVPEWAGLIRIYDNGRVRVFRMPTKLKKGKTDFEFRYKMARKLAYRFWEYRLGAR